MKRLRAKKKGKKAKAKKKARRGPASTRRIPVEQLPPNGTSSTGPRKA